MYHNFCKNPVFIFFRCFIRYLKLEIISTNKLSFFQIIPLQKSLPCHQLCPIIVINFTRINSIPILDYWSEISCFMMSNLLVHAIPFNLLPQNYCTNLRWEIIWEWTDTPSVSIEIRLKAQLFNFLYSSEGQE